MPNKYQPVSEPFKDSPRSPSDGDWDPMSLYDGLAQTAQTDPLNRRHSRSMTSPTTPSSSALSPTSPNRPHFPRQREMSQNNRDSISFGTRAPPSSYNYFAFGGNPDPGFKVPSVPRLQGSARSSRRSSIESLADLENSDNNEQPLPRPRAPFMDTAERRDSSGSFSSAVSSQNSVYRNSAAASASLTNVQTTGAALPRVSSATSFRAPFLSPASRPQSSIWTPPTPAYADSPTNSSSALAVTKVKPLAQSTRLHGKLDKQDKPWLTKRKDFRTRASWWTTFLCLILGVCGAAAICFSSFASTKLIPDNQLCLYLDENFDTFDNNTWNLDVEMGGFGNGEFQMTTNDPKNIYVQNNQLYLMPTLTRDSLSDPNQIFSGPAYNLTGCTSKNASACGATPNANLGHVLNPVRSARLNTQGKKTIAFGKVEVRAKLPKGDWLWPAIWMLPDNDQTYGVWPIGGEIDLMEARGNGITYQGQGSNFVRSSLNYGPLDSLLRTLTGWQTQKRESYADGFHTYSMEWDHKFMRLYVDSRLQAMLDLDVGKGWWDRAGFPPTAKNGSGDVVIENIYQEKGGSANAPFDQPFYLIIDLAVGGNSGWFPDVLGNKPWYDGSLTAMRDFAVATDTWYATWPTNPDERAFRIESVKMWNLC